MRILPTDSQIDAVGPSLLEIREAIVILESMNVCGFRGPGGRPCQAIAQGAGRARLWSRGPAVPGYCPGDRPCQAIVQGASRTRLWSRGPAVSGYGPRGWPCPVMVHEAGSARLWSRVRILEKWSGSHDPWDRSALFDVRRKNTV